MKFWAIFGVMTAFAAPAFAATTTEVEVRFGIVDYAHDKRVSREDAQTRRNQRLADADDSTRATPRRDVDRNTPRATEGAPAPRIEPRGRRNGAPSRVPDSMLLDPRGAL